MHRAKLTVLLVQVFKFKFKPTGRKVLGAPECYSLTFNEDGKVTSVTGGGICIL